MFIALKTRTKQIGSTLIGVQGKNYTRIRTFFDSHLCSVPNSWANCQANKIGLGPIILSKQNRSSTGFESCGFEAGFPRTVPRHGGDQRSRAFLNALVEQMCSVWIEGAHYVII